METNRNQWESKAAAARLGFRDLASAIESRRKAERRDSLAVYIGEERRKAERRATADSAFVAAWTRRFEESRRALA